MKINNNLTGRIIIESCQVTQLLNVIRRTHINIVKVRFIYFKKLHAIKISNFI